MPQDRVLLFTDAVDSTQLTERLGDEAAATLWAKHDRVVRRLMRMSGGREIDKSDGFLLLFDDVAAAVSCALQMHRELATLDPPLSCRAGIHRAPMVTRLNNADDQALGAKPLEVDGIGKAIASRIMMLARGGQTLLSADACSTLPNTGIGLKDPGWRMASHGHWRMKGLAEPIEIFEVAWADTPMLPPQDSPKSYRVVSTDDRWTPRAELRHGLPAERDAFIGRSDTLAALAARFHDSEATRLVTLLGIGGIGKSRLAQRYARDWLADYPGGAWFCDLSSTRSLDGIVQAAAQGLDVLLGKSEPVQQLSAAIAGRGRCLVILDNFEQVVGYAESTVGQWLECAPEAHFIVTSREVLGVPGEETFVLAPMVRHDAIRLFESRASAVTGRVALDDADRAALPRLVEMLDFLPLAIELAAARTRVMNVPAMLERIAERFKLLGTPGGRRERQATLRATLDWSWDLLSAAERSALAQLSVFEGGFTLEAAGAVVDHSDQPESPWVEDLLQGLIEKSLLGRLPSSRFYFLRTVLDYLAERCARREPAWAMPRVLAATRRHTRYFATLSEMAATANRCGEADNLMLACRRAIPDDKALAVRALVNLWAAIRMIGPLSAIAAPLAALEETAADIPPSEGAMLHWVAAGWLHQTGDLAQALERASAGLQLATDHADTLTRATLELTMADVLRSLGRLGESAAHAQQALAGAEEAGDPLATLAVLNSLGALHHIKGEYRDATSYYQRALVLARVAGREHWAGGLLGNLGVIARREGRLDESLRHFEDALALADRIGDRQWESNNRCNLALLHHDLGNFATAAEQLELVLRIIGEIGYAKLERFAQCNLGIVREAMNDQDGALSCFERAVALCLTAGDRHSECEFRGYLALHLARVGEHARALREFEKALADLRAMESPSALVQLLAQAALAAALNDQLDRSQALATEARRLLAVPGASNSIECSRLLDEVAAVAGQQSQTT